MKKVRNLLCGKEGLGLTISSVYIGTMAEVVRGELLPYDLDPYIVALMALLNDSPSFLEKSLSHVEPNLVVSRDRREGQIRHRYSHPLPD